MILLSPPHIIPASTTASFTAFHSSVLQRNLYTWGEHETLLEGSSALIGENAERTEMWEGRGEQPSPGESETSTEAVKCSLVCHTVADCARKVVIIPPSGFPLDIVILLVTFLSFGLGIKLSCV